MLHRYFADNTNAHSVASRLRRRRFSILLGMLEDAGGSVHILDIGGRAQYWEMMLGGLSLPVEPQITLLNTEALSVSRPSISAVEGDARAMPQYADQQFDIVFSNSTIEHVGDFADQQRMANEVRRVGRQYCIQTPNRHFPIEPHFVFPWFQYLPIPCRVWLVRHFKLGWYPRIRDRRHAEAVVHGIRLLSRAELMRLFPEADLYEERFLGCVKSFVAFRR
jgi:hypothetical protein